MELQKHSCDVCGKQFQVACLSELLEKLKKHKCVKVNKRVKRTAQLQQAHVDHFIEDVTVDRINQHRFDQLVNSGMIVGV